MKQGLDPGVKAAFYGIGPGVGVVSRLGSWSRDWRRCSHPTRFLHMMGLDPGTGVVRRHVKGFGPETGISVAMRREIWSYVEIGSRDCRSK